ncbi:MAG: type II toxin-antitoxin system mRNA interferase toxin, RelE/StbE family [Patescibacteria group bacterium]
MRVFTSKYFDKRYKKLPQLIKIKAEKKEKIFVVHPFDPRLETHKLHGKDKEHWAYSVDQKYRIKFLFLDNGYVLYLTIGTHDEVY